MPEFFALQFPFLLLDVSQVATPCTNCYLHVEVSALRLLLALGGENSVWKIREG